MSDRVATEPKPVAEAFHLFRELPPEIREIIWRLTVTPQIVVPRKCYSKTEGSISRNEYYFTSRWTPPQLFRISSESRMIASLIYHKAFKSKYTSHYIWFNFDLDTLYVDWGYWDFEHEYPLGVRDREDGDPDFRFGPEDLGEDIKSVMHIALLSFDPDLDKAMEFFENLKNMTIADIDLVDRGCHEFEILEYEDVLDDSRYNAFGEQDLHPVFREMFPKLDREHNSDLLWSDTLWDEEPYISMAELEYERRGNLDIPNFYYKPILEKVHKEEFLRCKQAYDEDRNAKRVVILLGLPDYEQHEYIEVSVPLLATMADLALIFCSTKGIDMTKESLESRVRVFKKHPQRGINEYATPLEDSVLVAGLDEAVDPTLCLSFQ